MNQVMQNLACFGLVCLLTMSLSCDTCSDAKVAEMISNNPKYNLGRDVLVTAPNDDVVILPVTPGGRSKAKLTIEVRNGAAVLNGHVGNEELKERFDGLAHDYSCVKSVQNNITFTQSKQDVEMQEMLMVKLKDIIPGYFEIHVVKGAVEIMGNVPKSKLQDVMKIIEDAKPASVNTERLNVING